MKKAPNRNKAWAEEAIEVMKLAWSLKFSSDINVDNRIVSLLNFAIDTACRYRGISDKHEGLRVRAKVLLLEAEDRERRTEAPVVPIIFLLGYIDANRELGFISERRGEEVIDYLMNNFDLEGFA